MLLSRPLWDIVASVITHGVMLCIYLYLSIAYLLVKNDGVARPEWLTIEGISATVCRFACITLAILIFLILMPVPGCLLLCRSKYSIKLRDESSCSGCFPDRLELPTNWFLLLRGRNFWLFWTFRCEVVCAWSSNCWFFLKSVLSEACKKSICEAPLLKNLADS